MLITNALFSPRCAEGFISLLLALCAAEVAAGSLDAPAAPTAPASAMYTLTDLYNRLDAGTLGVPRPGAFVEPTAGPTAGTGYTLNQIMAKMPTLDNANGAVVATLWTMQAGYDCLPGDVVACIGPSIGPASYEVGPEVLELALARLFRSPKDRFLSRLSTLWAWQAEQ